MNESGILFQISAAGQRLEITRNWCGHLILSIEGGGVRASIDAPYSDLYDLSDWLERYMDSDGGKLEVQP